MDASLLTFLATSAARIHRLDRVAGTPDTGAPATTAARRVI